MTRLIVAILFICTTNLASPIDSSAEGNQRVQSEYKDIISTTSCHELDTVLSREIIGNITLRFYYGQEERSFVQVLLEDASRLVHHARWHPDGRVVLYFFGFNSSPHSPSTRAVVKAYAQRGRDFNMVLVNWEGVTARPYAAAVAMTTMVAISVGEAVDALVAQGATLGHIVGHSLGAQVAGATARFARSRVPLVVGLDPAGPLFYNESVPGRQCARALGPRDATCVLSLHTSFGLLGAPTSAGRVNFFPQGDASPQPWCKHQVFASFMCEHQRAVWLWAEAVADRKTIVGRFCSSWQALRDGQCEPRSTRLPKRCARVMGEFLHERPRDNASESASEFSP